MTELQRQLRIALYEKSLYEYVKAFWHTVEPAKFVDGILLEYYCEVFQYMSRKWVPYTEVNVSYSLEDDVDIIDIRENKNKACIMVPPRHTKSLIFNVFGPTWLWLHRAIKATSVSHTKGLATDMNRKRHMLLNSEEFQFFFPDVILVKNTETSLIDIRGAELYSVCRAAFTGYGADIIINDDLTNAETARKDKAEMENAWSYYQNTMPSRVNNIFESVILNIQQRLAPNDVAGHIMSDRKLSALYTFITLPAIFKRKTKLIFPISGRVVTFEEGDFLWPERFGDYKELRDQVGETIFQTQYLQNAIATDKTVVKENMICEKDENEVPSIEQADVVYGSHDFPVKDKESSDYLGSILAYRVNSTLYIIDCLEKKMAFVAGVKYVKHLDEAFAGIIQIIEDKANGSPILQQIQDEVSGAQAYNPGTASKTQRLESASLYMESKNVVFVRREHNKLTSTYELSENLQNLKTRLLNFPFVKHDDIVDAFSMLVLYVFMDKKFSVYGRSVNSDNIVDISNVYGLQNETIFFNREGDIWKAIKVSVTYDEKPKIYITDEIKFKATIEDAKEQLQKFAPRHKLFLDASESDSLRGLCADNFVVEKYNIKDFDRSVTQTNFAFSKKLILLNSSCKLTKSDIDSFKFSKSKDESAKYITTHDGFVSCIRLARHYFGIQ